jgi:hypothetical protein
MSRHRLRLGGHDQASTHYDDRALATLAMASGQVD